MLEIDVKAGFGDFELTAALEAAAGVTALVGRSGAGKSSLLRLLAGLSRPKAGRIALGDQVFFDAAKKVWVLPEKRHIGMVFQRPALVPHLSVLANIRLGYRHAQSEDPVIIGTGCEKLLDRPISALSGGEQQRVMLARALVGSPSLLLMDEPLSALDAASKAELLNLFATIFPTLDVPVIYVTHAMDEAARVAAHFALMDAGRIVLVGGAATVLAHYSGHAGSGVASVLPGTITDIADDGLVTIKVGAQRVEAIGGGLLVGMPVLVRLWARDVVLARTRPSDISARNALAGTIAALNDLPGGQVEVHVAVEGQTVTAIVMARTVKDMQLAAGQSINALFKSASIEPLPAHSS